MFINQRVNNSIICPRMKKVNIHPQMQEMKHHVMYVKQLRIHI